MTGESVALVDDLNQTIRDVPDFPKPGILFKDITPVLADPVLMQRIIDHLVERLAPHDVGVICGVESRGFIFGTPLAIAMNKPFVLARKPGKLPYEKVRVEYALEYGTNTLEMHTDSVQPGQRVAIVDDLLATGGTADATRQLVEELGGTVACYAFVIELSFLSGRDRLTPVPCESILTY